MEPPITFDLNESLARWREGLKNRPAIRAEDIEELESHLSDTLGDLRKAGLSEEEAFWVATHRVGHPAALEGEYQRVRPGTVWRERAQWMILGVAVLWLVTGMAALGSLMTLCLGGKYVANGVALGYVGLAVQGLVFLGLAWLAHGQLTRTGTSNFCRFSVSSPRRLTRLTLGLVIAAVLAKISAGLLQVLAVRLNSPVVVGGYSLVIMWGGPVFMTLAIMAVVGWLVRSQQLLKRTMNAAVFLLISSALITGCKPSGTPAGGGQPAQANQTTASGFESCMELMKSDTNSAVEAFLKLDLSKSPLFSFGTPLSYSEAEFMKLPPVVSTKLGQQATADLALVKRLVQGVKARGQQAKTAGESALAEKCHTQLATLAQCLEGPDNLKITQLVGKAIAKMAKE